MKKRVLWMAVCLVLILSTVIAPVSASAKSGVAKIYKISTNANLRDPDDYQHIMTFLKKGTKVLWTGKTNSKNKAFYLVTTTDGKTGYVFRDNLSEYGAVNLNQVYKTSSKTKLYKKPSTGSSSIATVGKGRYVLVYSTASGWAYVKTTSGKGGYMKLSSLKKY